MRKRNFKFINFFFILCFFTNVWSQEKKPEQIYVDVNPAVVTIFTMGFDGRPVQQGSGVVINKEGWIVSNFHVFDGGKYMMVKQGDRMINQVHIIAVDPGRDLIILKVKANYFTYVETGDAEILKVGQLIYTIGSPLGYENTMASGLVSGKRANDENGNWQVQISASISAGSSGGAVVDAFGRLIGITTRTVSGSQNLNFAVPINDVLKMKCVSTKDYDSLLAFNHYWKGRSAYNFKKNRDAVSEFNECITVDSSFKNAYFFLGRTYSKMGLFDSAILQFDKVIELDSMNSNAYVNKALCFDYLKKYDKAIETYLLTLKVKPNDAAIYNNIGIIYMDNFKDQNAAFSYFQKCLEIDPNFDLALMNIGVIYSNRKDYPKAIEKFQKAIKINPKEPYRFGNLADCFYHIQEYNKAIYNCKKSLRLDKRSKWMNHFLADLYYVVDDYIEAMSYYKRSIGLNSENGKAYYYLAQCQKNLGNKVLYKKFLKKAFFISPELKDKSKQKLMIDSESK